MSIVETRVWPELRKLTSTGKVQTWNIRVDHHDDDHSEIVVVHGQEDGKKQTTSTKVTVGKNVGRANETTPREQAELESEAKWKKQLDKGYTDKQEVVRPTRKPMLAHDYAKYKHQVAFPCLIQPKLDGIRCLALKDDGEVKLFSRMGKPIDTVPHINSALNAVMEDGETWDGELYTPGITFQTLTSLVKKAQPKSAEVQYHIYDAVADTRFISRFRNVELRIRMYPGELSPIHPVKTLTANSHEHVTELHNEFVGDGYEGAMLRVGDCQYKENYRSRSLLKVKSFAENEYEIVGVSEGKGKYEGCAVYKLVTENGTSFECLAEGPVELKRQRWQERESLIGKMATIKFFELTSSDNPVPRFPISKGIRDYD